MSHSNQEISPSAKILVLVGEGEVSPEIQAKLTQLKSQGFEYDLRVINRTESIRENEKNIVSAINAQNYKLILVDRNVNLPVWAIIDKSSQQKSKPKFYLEGNAHQLLTREMNFINFSGVIDIVKDGKTLFAEAYKEANQSLDIKQAFRTQLKIDLILVPFRNLLQRLLLFEWQMKKLNKKIRASPRFCINLSVN